MAHHWKDPGWDELPIQLRPEPGPCPLDFFPELPEHGTAHSERVEPDVSAPLVLACAEASEPAKRPRSKPWWWLGSVLVHGIFAGLVLLVSLSGPKLPERTDAVEIFTVDADQLPLERIPIPSELESTPRSPMSKPEPQRGQVLNLAPPEHEVSAADQARFLAADNHRVEREERPRAQMPNPEVVADRPSAASQEGGGAQDESGQTDVDSSDPPSLAETARVAALSREQPSHSEPRRLQTSPQPLLEPSSTAPAQEEPVMAPSLERSASAREAPEIPDRAAPRLSPEQLFPSPSRMAGLLSQGAAGRGSGRGPRLGNPDNDVLDLPEGERTRVNAARDPFISYYLALRKQFNFYYGQACDNLRAQEVGQRLFQKTYVTRFTVVVLADGRVGAVRITQSAGVSALDGLVLEALRNASPLPPPPPGLLDTQGQLVIGGECRLGVGLGAPSFVR